jgi:hypothetical protein
MKISSKESGDNSDRKMVLRAEWTGETQAILNVLKINLNLKEIITHDYYF